MEQIYAQLSRRRLWEEYQTSTTENISVSEVWHEDSSRREVTVHRTITISTIASWLRDTTKRTPEGLSCSAKFAWVQSDETRIRRDIQSTALHKLLYEFGLQKADEFYASAFAGSFVLPVQPSAAQHIRCYCFSYHPKLAVIWSQDCNANVIQGVVFATAPQIFALRELLGAEWRLSTHEMMPAFIVSFMLSSEIDQIHIKIKKCVREVEVRTGYHQFTNRREEAAADTLGELSAKMSGHAAKLASTTRKMRALSDLHEFILEHTNENKIASEDAMLESNSAEVLRSHITLMQKRLKMQMLDNDYILERVGVQRSALSSIIAQRDALVSLELARDSKIIAMYSKRDSSAMKTLAIVTMLFLPGTFVASLFSMPLFDWSGNSNAIVGPNFRLYWAVTLPLTFTTLLVYAIWSVWYHRQTKDETMHVVEMFNEANGEPEVRTLSFQRSKTKARLSV